MKRRTWLACLLSLFSIGLGQVYNGQLKKGILFYFGAFCFSSVALYASIAVSQYRILNLLLLFAAIMPNIIFTVEAGFSANIIKTNFTLKKYNRWYFYLLYIFLVQYGLSIPLAGNLKNFVVKAYKIPTGAMEKSIKIGDFILSDQTINLGNQREKIGDIVVFLRDKVALNSFGVRKVSYIKRIVASSGQTVKIDGKDLYVNDRIVTPPPNAQFNLNGIIQGFPSKFQVSIPSPGMCISFDTLPLREVFFAYNIIKQENKHSFVSLSLQLFKNGSNLKNIPLQEVDDWIVLEKYVNFFRDTVASQLKGTSKNTEKRLSL
jgi:signal peptidase I